MQLPITHVNPCHLLSHGILNIWMCHQSKSVCANDVTSLWPQICVQVGVCWDEEPGDGYFSVCSLCWICVCVCVLGGAGGISTGNWLQRIRLWLQKGHGETEVRDWGERKATRGEVRQGEMTTCTRVRYSSCEEIGGRLCQSHCWNKN